MAKLNISNCGSGLSFQVTTTVVLGPCSQECREGIEVPICESSVGKTMQDGGGNSMPAQTNGASDVKAGSTGADIPSSGGVTGGQQDVMAERPAVGEGGDEAAQKPAQVETAAPSVDEKPQMEIAGSSDTKADSAGADIQAGDKSGNQPDAVAERPAVEGSSGETGQKPVQIAPAGSEAETPIAPVNLGAPYTELEKSWIEARGYDTLKPGFAALPGKMTAKLTWYRAAKTPTGFAIDFVGLRNDPGLILANSNNAYGLFIGFNAEGNFVIRTKSPKGIYPDGTGITADVAIYDGSKIQGDGTLAIYFPESSNKAVWPRLYWQGDHIAPIAARTYSNTAHRIGKKPLAYLADTTADNVPEGLPVNKAGFFAASGLRGYSRGSDIHHSW